MGLVYIYPVVTLLNSNNVNETQDYIFYIQCKYLKIKLLLPHLCYDQHMNIVVFLQEQEKQNWRGNICLLFKAFCKDGSR